MTTTPTTDTIDDEIRLPGGILFPSLCAEHFERNVVAKLLRIAMHFAIKTMVRLKNPDEIILMAHDPCGAALAMKLSPERSVAVHLEWMDILRNQFPTLTITLLHEEHCAVGDWRHPHKVIAA
jgi:hypothetical protein